MPGRAGDRGPAPRVGDRGRAGDDSGSAAHGRSGVGRSLRSDPTRPGDRVVLQLPQRSNLRAPPMALRLRNLGLTRIRPLALS